MSNIVKNTKNEKKKASNIDKGIIYKRITVSIVVLLIPALILAFHLCIKKAVNTFNERVNDLSDNISNTVYNYAEKKYHVSNDLYVEVGKITKNPVIEVLKVRDTEFITDEKDADGIVTSWLQVVGEGIFTVDLKTAEYLYDASRQMITVVVRDPELSYCNLISGEDILFEKGLSIKNGSYRKGEELARKQLQSGYIAIYDYFTTNPQFVESAKSSAEKIIANFIYQLYNPEEISVLVKFVN